VQVRLEAVVGTPYTKYDGDPLVIAKSPIAAVTENAVVLVSGVVENVNVEPPLDVDKTIDDMLVDETVKSFAIPVVTPVADDTVIVHEIDAPTRSGLLVVHDKLD